MGLGFEPKSGRELVDVKGVLWVDTVTGGPEELEFQYTSLRPFLRQHLLPLLRQQELSRLPEGLRYRASSGRIEIDESLFGGELQFERIAHDRWLIREWTIRRPRLGRFTLTEPGRHTVWPRAFPLTVSGEVLAIIPP